MMWTPEEQAQRPVQPRLPGLAQRAANIARAASAVVAHAATHGGQVLAAPEVQAARWRVCEHGEGLVADQIVDGHCDRFRVSDKVCGGMKGCGCHLRIAIPLIAKKCPLNRWPA